MRRITLIMREEMADCRLPIEAEAICPETMSKTIDLSLFVGNEKKKITEVFDIRVDGEAAGPATTEIILVGDCSRVKRVGEYMTAGKIIIEGDIGMHCGDFMTGGEIEIMGHAGDWLGREMLGGKIICHPRSCCSQSPSSAGSSGRAGEAAPRRRRFSRPGCRTAG